MASRAWVLVFAACVLTGCATPIINTVAGSGEFCTVPTDPCGDGGPVIQAQFNSPRVLTAMPGGGYLVADRMVTAVTPDAIIDTIAGTGNSAFRRPRPAATAGPRMPRT